MQLRNLALESHQVFESGSHTKSLSLEATPKLQTSSFPRFPSWSQDLEALRSPRELHDVLFPSDLTVSNFLENEETGF